MSNARKVGAGIAVAAAGAALFIGRVGDNMIPWLDNARPVTGTAMHGIDDIPPSSEIKTFQQGLDLFAQLEKSSSDDQRVRIAACWVVNNATSYGDGTSGFQKDDWKGAIEANLAGLEEIDAVAVRVDQAATALYLADDNFQAARLYVEHCVVRN